MIFTMGHKESYDSGIAMHGAAFLKLGKTDDYKGAPYPGGAAFKTYADAQAYASAYHPTWAVYGVLADWDKDTEQLPGEPYRRLLRTAQIVHAD